MEKKKSAIPQPIAPFEFGIKKDKMSNRIFPACCGLLWLLLGPLQAQTPIQDQIYLWPGTAPGSEAVSVAETITDRDPNGGDCHLNRVVAQVSQPSLKAFLPDNPNGTAVLLCPGGGYARLAYDKEGYDLAQWFNQRDITAFVLKYRLPIDGHADRQFVPLQDAQRAMRYLRAHADSFQIDPDSIGVMGGSAGGHLAATLSVHHDWAVYAPVDSLDSLSARPNFTVLMYPVVSFQDSLTHGGSRNNLLGSPLTQARKDSFSAEIHVDSLTPPAFLFHARSDGSVSYRNSVAYARALDSAGVGHALHLYRSGGHGVGKCEAGNSDFAAWPVDLDRWLTQQGWANACLGDPPSISISPEDSTRLVSTPASGYQWYRDDRPIEGATDSIYQADRSGYYRVATGGQRTGTQSTCQVFSHEIILDICNGFAPAITLDGDQLISNRSGRLQWFLNGEPIPGATQRVYTPTDTGTYVVASIYSLPLSGEDCFIYSDPVYLETLTSIQARVEALPRLYPNPAATTLHLRQLPWSGPGLAYTIFDTQGRQIAQGDLAVQQATAQIDISGLSPGLYHLMVTDQTRWLKGRFGKQ